MRSYLALLFAAVAVGSVGCSVEGAEEETGSTDDALTVSTKVTCSSNDHHYESCPTQGNRIRSVRVTRQLSSAPCREGQSFGHGDNYIWVNYGCRAEFEVRVDMGGGPSVGRRIRILSATYGNNTGAAWGNATNSVRRQCEGERSCDYRISSNELGDPSWGRPKDFLVEYSCGDDGPTRSEYVDPEANGQRVRLSCENVVQPGTCGALTAGQSLGRGQSVRSCDGRTSFVHQADGNVVLYHDGDVVASTGEFDSRTDKLTLRRDGDLVQTSRDGREIWASNTPGHQQPRLVVQDDCDVVLLDRDGRMYWHTNTSGCYEH